MKTLLIVTSATLRSAAGQTPDNHHLGGPTAPRQQHRPTATRAWPLVALLLVTLTGALAQDSRTGPAEPSPTPPPSRSAGASRSQGLYVQVCPGAQLPRTFEPVQLGILPVRAVTAVACMLVAHSLDAKPACAQSLQILRHSADDVFTRAACAVQGLPHPSVHLAMSLRVGSTAGHGI